MQFLSTTRRATACALLVGLVAAQDPQPAFADDPAAHRQYDQMIAALRAAKSLRYESDYRWWGGKDRAELGHCRYVAELRKPNQFRLTATAVGSDRGGTLVGDGETMWLFWHGARPFFSSEDPATYSSSRDRQYMKKPAPPGGHSISHETSLLGAGMSMTILDPSTFHGYTDSLQPYLDGVQHAGNAAPIEGEPPCEVLRVSLMKGQRTWELWVSPIDHLPRRLRETIHLQHDTIVEERWTKVEIDADLAEERFRWMPPAGYTEWSMPRPEDRLLKPGTVAPDFDLLLADGGRWKLSDHRGTIVWLVFWRVG